MGANVSPLFQSMHPDIIHSHSVCLSFFLSHSDALRCVRSYIHHLSRASVFFLSGSHTHSSRQHILSLLLSKEKKRKEKGVLVAKRPNAPLDLSSRYHIHFMQSFSWALPERQPLRLTVSSLWLRCHMYQQG